MSNFFAALDDSDNEGRDPVPAVVKKKEKAPVTPTLKKEVVEPSKVETRPSRNDRDKKGGRAGRVPARDGKRAYERRSGTGRGKEIKKGGGGGHNWGSEQIDAKKAEGGVDDANNPAEEETEKEAVEEDATGEEEKNPAREPEPEDNTMSYDEYLATKATPDLEVFKPLEERKVDNEFAGKAATMKETEDFLVMGGGKQPKKKGSAKKEPEKLVLDFKIKSAITDERDGGGRREGRRDGGGGRDGGRGGRREGGERRDGRGGRGGGDRGGRRERGGRGPTGGGGGEGRGSKGIVFDANAFPSL